MKRLLIAGCLATALTLTAFSQQQASAWCKVNFSAGVNYSYEGGGNSAFWGCFKGSQIPGYPCDYGRAYGPFNCGGQGYAPAYCGYGDYGAYGASGAYGSGYTYGYGYAPYAAPAQAAPVQQAGYYFPDAYGYNQAPSYWYGR